jgi:hypothetical protein
MACPMSSCRHSGTPSAKCGCAVTAIVVGRIHFACADLFSAALFSLPCAIAHLSAHGPFEIRNCSAQWSRQPNCASQNRVPCSGSHAECLVWLMFTRCIELRQRFSHFIPYLYVWISTHRACTNVEDVRIHLRFLSSPGDCVDDVRKDTCMMDTHHHHHDVSSIQLSIRYLEVHSCLCIRNGRDP